jgi:hypothetical protein
MGRRNRYELHPEVAMRHPRIGHALLRDITMGELVAPLMGSSSPNGGPPARAQDAAGREQTSR